MTENDDRLMSCFKKTGIGNIEMIIFTIAKRF